MGQFIVFATEDRGYTGSALEASSIESALRNIPIALRKVHGVGDSGGWVGNARITRQAPSVGRRVDYVAWLYEYPAWNASLTPAAKAHGDTEMRSTVIDQANDALQALSTSWSRPVVVEYNPAVNGSRDWWASGQAAATHTRDEANLNQQLGASSVVENPTGPELASPPPDLNLLTLVGGIPSVQALSGTLKTVGWIAAGGVVLYLAWPFLVSARGMGTRRERVTFQNPSTRRRKKSTTPTPKDLSWRRHHKKRGSVMKPSTFKAIEREAKRQGYDDPKAVAGAAYWRTLKAKASKRRPRR